MALRTVIIAIITEVLDFYNRNGVFLLRRSTWGWPRRLVAGGRRPVTAWARPQGVALRHPFLWIRWFHVSIIQSVWGLLRYKVALGHTRCSLNNSDCLCQYHSLAVHMRSVMEKCLLVQVSVWVFWLSAVTVFQSIGDLWWTKRRSDKLFSPCTPVFLLSLSCTPCEISGGRIGAGTEFSLSVSFHQYPIPIFCMKIVPERQTSEVWESGRCDWKTAITFVYFVHGSDQTIGRYFLSGCRSAAKCVFIENGQSCFCKVCKLAAC